MSAYIWVLNSHSITFLIETQLGQNYSNDTEIQSSPITFAQQKPPEMSILSHTVEEWSDRNSTSSNHEIKVTHRPLDLMNDMILPPSSSTVDPSMVVLYPVNEKACEENRCPDETGCYRDPEEKDSYSCRCPEDFSKSNKTHNTCRSYVEGGEFKLWYSRTYVDNQLTT